MKTELIGKKIKIIESKNKSLEGIRGIVVDETMNTLIISNGKERKIVKDQCVFEIDGMKTQGKNTKNENKHRN